MRWARNHRPKDLTSNSTTKSRGTKKRPQHASWLEDNVIADLEKRGVQYEYEPESFKFNLPVHRGKCARCQCVQVYTVRQYTPDLQLKGASGIFYVEIKGKLTGEIRSRMEAFHRDNPLIDLRFLFQRDNWLTKKHKTRYSDWAKKVGFKFHIGEKVPDEWLQKT